MENILSRASSNPSQILVEYLKDEDELQAYMVGVKKFGWDQPSYTHLIPKDIQTQLLQDKDIYEKWKKYWIDKAKKNTNVKLANPFGDKLYEIPEVIDAIREHTANAIYYNGKESANIVIPGLAEEIKNDPNFTRKVVDHWKKKLDTELAYYYDDESHKPKPPVNNAAKKEIDDYALSVYFRDIFAYNDYVYRIFENEIENDAALKDKFIGRWIYKLKMDYDLNDIKNLSSKSTNYLSPPNFVVQDPRFQRQILINKWITLIRKDSANISKIPQEIRNDQQITDMLAFMNLLQDTDPKAKSNELTGNMGTTENSGNMETTENGVKQDGLAQNVAKSLDNRTVWASAFNDNIIIKF